MPSRPGIGRCRRPYRGEAAEPTNRGHDLVLQSARMYLAALGAVIEQRLRVRQVLVAEASNELPLIRVGTICMALSPGVQEASSVAFFPARRAGTLRARAVPALEELSPGIKDLWRISISIRRQLVQASLDHSASSGST